MKKLLVKISVVLVLLAACDMLAGLGLDWLRDHSPDGRYYKTKYSLEACNEDVVVIDAHGVVVYTGVGAEQDIVAAVRQALPGARAGSRPAHVRAGRPNWPPPVPASSRARSTPTR